MMRIVPSKATKLAVDSETKTHLGDRVLLGNLGAALMQRTL
jgi:hypothetical protein